MFSVYSGPSCHETPGHCEMSPWLSSATPLPISQMREPFEHLFGATLPPRCHSAVCSFSGLSIAPVHLSKGIYLGCFHLELMTPASWDFLSRSGIPGQLLRDSVSKETYHFTSQTLLCGLGVTALGVTHHTLYLCQQAQLPFHSCFGRCPR